MKERRNAMIILVILLLVVLLITIAIDHKKRVALDELTIAKINSLYLIDTTRYKQDTPTVRYRSYQLLHLNLNTASKQELMAVYGIGEVLSARIIKYRDELGGYYSVEQLSEIRAIDKEVYEKIFRNFYVPDNSYSKISINFASPESLQAHPYFTVSMVRRMEVARKRGGYFTNLQELIDNDILLPAEALRVAPYLSCEINKTENN